MLTDYYKSRRNWQSVKLICAIGAALMVLYIFFVSNFSVQVANKITLSSITNNSPIKEFLQSEVTKPVLSGLDQHSRPYTFTADSATQIDAENVTLKRVQGRAQEAAGKQLVINAKMGSINIKTKEVALSNEVIMRTSDALIFKSQAVKYYPQQAKATSTVPATVTQHKNRLFAEGGFEMQENGSKTRFHGPISMTLYPEN